MAEAIRLEGNAQVKAKDYVQAIKLYKKGLGLLPDKKDPERVNFHKNLALCYIKLENYKDAIKQSTEALELSGGDVKALFRRAQAYEGDGEPEKAFQDVVNCTKLDPKNATFKKAANRLMQLVSAKRNTKQSTAGIGADVMTKVTTADTPAKRKQAANNLAAYSQDEPGAWHLFKNDGMKKLLPLLELEGEDDTVHALLHTFASVGSNSWQRAVGILGVIGQAGEATLVKLIQSPIDRTARAAVMILSKMLEAVSEDGVEDLMAKAAMNKILQFLVGLIPNGQIVAAARDASISALVKCSKKSDVSKRFVDLGGIRALLTAASCSISPIEKAKIEGEDEKAESFGIKMSKETRMQISVALSYVFAATCTNERGKKLMDQINPDAKQKRMPYPPFAKDCIDSIKWTKDPVMNIPVVQTLTAIIQGVAEIGNLILDTDERVMGKLIKMAQCEDQQAKCAAAEALAHAATSKERSKVLMESGFKVLKMLYSKELPDAIRVRALCGLCKLGSQGGGFANKKTLADGAVVNLAKKIRPFLVDERKDLDCAKWASEGLAYLSLDADVKEMVVGDKKILKVIKKLCLDGDPTVQFGLANLLVNVTNTFDIPETSEEKETLKKIGKFAGEYIPEPHKLDAEEYILRRIKIMVSSNMPEAMVALCKSDSDQAREQVARVFLGMCKDKEHRGVIVAEGGARALVGLANKNTEKGKLQAAQALAKIGITANPEIAFPGQRASEVVRPLLLLAKQPNGLMQFEACMALTNLASVSEDLRMRFVREDGIKTLEDLIYEDDWRIRRVAVECLTNLMYCEKVYEMYATKEGKCWERLKLLILLAGSVEDDYETARAASGCIALLSDSPDVCMRITEEKQGMLIMKENAACGDKDLQMRALHTMKNMAHVGKEIAEILADDQGLELLSALHLTLEDPALKGYVSDILDQMIQHGIITHVKDAHKKGLEAAETLASFKRPIEEEEEGDDDDEEEDAEDNTATELEEDLDLSWPGAREKAEQEAAAELEAEGIPKIEEIDDEPEAAGTEDGGDEYIEVDGGDGTAAEGTDAAVQEAGLPTDGKVVASEADAAAPVAAAAVAAEPVVVSEMAIETPAEETAIETPAEETADPDESFTPANEFDGSREGWVFRKGAKGTGYYKDVKPAVSPTALPEAPKVDPKKMMMSFDLD